MVEDRVIPRVVRVLRQRLLYDILVRAAFLRLWSRPTLIVSFLPQGDCGCNAPSNDAPEFQGDDAESLPPAVPTPHWKPNGD